MNINGFTPKYEVNRYKQIQQVKEKSKIWKNKTTQLLCDYLHSLNGIEEDYLQFKKAEENYIKNIKSTLKK